MAKTTEPASNAGKPDPAPEKKPLPEKRVHLVLQTEVDGVGAWRVVSAGETRADALIKGKKAVRATPAQVARAAANIPQLAG